MTRNDSIADLVLAIGRPAFPERLVAAAGATLPMRQQP